MRNIYKRIPITVAFICCVMLMIISAAARQASITAMAEAEERPVVVIDPGHGGMDSGAVGVNGCYEKDINLEIAKYLGELLEFSGFEVVFTRNEDISVHDQGVVGIRNQKISDMENRLETVNSYPDSIFLSIHQNRFTEAQYFGGQMFYTTNNPGNFKFATVMQECFAELQPGNNREIKLIDNNLYLFKDTKQLALLIECGFLSNDGDAAKLSESDYQKKVAFTIFKGLEKYLGAESAGAEAINGEAENGLYMQ